MLVLAVVAALASCTPTPTDAFGPFGRGLPPLRTSIGHGHAVTGTVLSAVSCRPLRGARVELWQSGRDGRYTRAGSATVLTRRDGSFRFEGPPPTSYEGLPPHIHVRVTAKDHETLVTRIVVPRGTRHSRVRFVLRPIAL